MKNWFGFQLDFWTLVGVVAQFLFLVSFLIQWYQSEKRKKSYLSAEFWGLRIVAALIILVYSVVRKDLVFLISAILQVVIYSRNMQLVRQERKIEGAL